MEKGVSVEAEVDRARCHLQPLQCSQNPEPPIRERRMGATGSNVYLSHWSEKFESLYLQMEMGVCLGGAE